MFKKFKYLWTGVDEHFTSQNTISMYFVEFIWTKIQ